MAGAHSWTARIATVGLKKAPAVAMFHHAVLLLEDSDSSDRIAIEYHAQTYEPLKNYFAEELNNDVFVYHVKPGTDAIKPVTTTEAFGVDLRAVTREAAKASTSGEFTKELFDATGLESWGKVTNCQHFVLTVCEAVPELADLVEEYMQKYTVHSVKGYAKRVVGLLMSLSADKQKAVQEEVVKLEEDGQDEEAIFEYIWDRYQD